MLTSIPLNTIATHIVCHKTDVSKLFLCDLDDVTIEFIRNWCSYYYVMINGQSTVMTADVSKLFIV